MLVMAHGDLLKADAEALVNPVNCVGVMGKGIAAQFKLAFPDNFATYEDACRRGDVRPGSMLVVATDQRVNPHWIINFPTKRHWRANSRIDDIEIGLVALVAEITRHNIRSLAVPALGCGLGGLQWSDVRPRIEHAFEVLPEVCVLLFAPTVAERTSRPSDHRR
jgi:O-acetyl-ADP-ribose deacetylase (regulator of RNase III)